MPRISTLLAILNKIANGRISVTNGKKGQRRVIFTRIAAGSITSYSMGIHPNEAIIILRGRSTREQVTIDGLAIPPFGSSGPHYSGFSDFFLPFNCSYFGTAPFHPSKSNRPSLDDLNSGFYDTVSIIIGYPNEDDTMVAYERDGNALKIKVLNSA